MNEQIFDAVFWSFFITSGIGLILGMTKMAYKSKCKEVSCCCIKIIRDVENEVTIDELVIENQEEKKDIG
tara:strand:+ start:285 stop:494 length:210 start_codon:yes stop_codon:yes gene_type:complete